MTFVRKFVAAAFLVAVVSVGGCATPPPSEPLPSPVIPPGPAPDREWPDSLCEPGQPARAWLDQIQTLATEALRDPKLAPPIRAQVERALAAIPRCVANTPPTLPDPEHCAKVRRALAFAQAGEWANCSQELEHGHN